MSTTSPELPENDDHKPEGPTEPEGHAKPAEPKPGPPGETFTRAYVEELRQEAAKHRTNSKKADELAQRLVASLVDATGKLHDPRDLAFTEALLDPDGYPDPEKVTEAVEALIKDRPHLARIRPVGDVGQGVTSDSNPAGLAAFGNMLREAAR
jgi:hypothetical protein